MTFVKLLFSDAMEPRVGDPTAVLKNKKALHISRRTRIVDASCAGEWGGLDTAHAYYKQRFELITVSDDVSEICVQAVNTSD